MFILASTVFFAIAFILHGSGASIHSAWFNYTGFELLGLTFLAAHFIRDRMPW